ncbi:MAG: thioeseterase, partial [Bacteroidetes bacterium]
RTGVTSSKGIVKVEEVIRTLNFSSPVPPLPEWAKVWVEADELHPK